MSIAPSTDLRGRQYELLDAGILDDERYWDITVDYAKDTIDRDKT